MPGATRTTKLGRELVPGDALVFLDRARIITHFDDGAAGVRTVYAGGRGCFSIHDEQEVTIEEAAPGEYDGYISEVPGGFELALDGVSHGVIEDEALAATALTELGPGRVRWKVDSDGRAMRLG